MNGTGLMSLSPDETYCSATRINTNSRGFEVSSRVVNEDMLLDLRPGLRYRTPAEIRAIPNAQWERWLATDGVPWLSFAASADCQMALRYVLKAHMRRIGL